MQEVLLAFGRGLIKVLISLMLGAGAGLVTFGYSAKDRPDLWWHRDPPAELFLGIGVGLLTAAAVMLALFFVWPRLAPRLTDERGRRAGPDPDTHFTDRPPR
jgi:hypothetical protein